MAGSDDDEIIAGKRPKDGTKGGHPHLEIEGAQEDVEAQQHHKYQYHIVGEVELIDALRLMQAFRRGIGGSYLVGGHAAKESVGPTGAFTVALAVLLHLMGSTGAAAMIMTRQDVAFADGAGEVEEGKGQEEKDGQEVGEEVFQMLHC